MDMEHRSRGDFFDFVAGSYDGAQKGQVDVIVPFIGGEKVLGPRNGSSIVMCMGGRG